NGFSKIHMPSNTSAGVFGGFFSFVFGFSLVWDILWVVGVGLIGFFSKVVGYLLKGGHHWYDGRASVRGRGERFGVAGFFKKKKRS
ncbi:hypothetical protein, partial [Bartonella vinsonii]|uniref:hypothetical protein n=1 Tax=Bartonella vinsonii TaxID=33047 RepID=UPI001ABAC3DE